MIITEEIKDFEFFSPTRIIFGVGSIKKVGPEIEKIGGKKILITTDKGIVKSNLLDGIVNSIKQSNLPYVIYDEVEPNPSIETVEKGYEILKREGSDLLLGVGGGSSIDTAKAIGILATNPGPLHKYEGANKFPNPTLPIVAIPTAAGTGAEVSFSAVVTDRKRNYKISIRSPWEAPKLAILDPAMLSTLPPHIAAATGMDTLTHAIEAYLSTGSTALTDFLALGSISLVSENLRNFVANPQNLRAASLMQVACVSATIAFMNARLGNAHALAHPLGGHFNLPHGIACAITLPHVMEFNLIANPRKFCEIARYMGENIEGLPLREGAAKAIEAVRRLSKDLGLPTCLREVGVTEDKIPAMAQDAINSGIHLPNPRRTSLEDIVNLYKVAM